MDRIVLLLHNDWQCHPHHCAWSCGGECCHPFPPSLSPFQHSKWMSRSLTGLVTDHLTALHWTYNYESFMASPISTPRSLPQLPTGLPTFLSNHQLARPWLYVNAILASFMDLQISKNETSGKIHPITLHHTPEYQNHQYRCCENLNTNVPSLWEQGFRLLLILLLLLFGNFKWIS